MACTSPAVRRRCGLSSTCSRKPSPIRGSSWATCSAAWPPASPTPARCAADRAKEDKEMRTRIAAALAALTLAASAAAAQRTVEECKGTDDKLERLRCYDELHDRVPVEGTTPSQAAATAPPAQPAAASSSQCARRARGGRGGRGAARRARGGPD